MEPSQSSSGSIGWEILKNPAACKVDIVFLHGLTGSRRSTFTHKNGRCWPQDFLPDVCPHARIMTFGYDADVVDFKKMASQDNLRANAKSLLEALSDARRAVVARQDTTATSRPLFFVTHSLGGLLCKQALVLACSHPEYRQIFDAYAGIIFIGTPHKGSKQAKLGGVLVSMVNVVRPANKGLVNMLKKQSLELSALDDDFWALMDGTKRNCHVHCYHESAPMMGLGIIVSSESASRPGGSSSSLEGNHRNMLKFKTRQDAGYLSISNKLMLWIGDLPLTQPTLMTVSLAKQSIFCREAVEADPGPSHTQLSEVSSAAVLIQNPNKEQQAEQITSHKYEAEQVANNREQAELGKISFSSPFNDCTFQKQVFPNMVNQGGHNNFTFH